MEGGCFGLEMGLQIWLSFRVDVQGRGQAWGRMLAVLGTAQHVLKEVMESKWQKGMQSHGPVGQRG